jgi:hypothetical protein
MCGVVSSPDFLFFVEGHGLARWGGAALERLRLAGVPGRAGRGWARSGGGDGWRARLGEAADDVAGKSSRRVAAGVERVWRSGRARARQE